MPPRISVSRTLTPLSRKIHTSSSFLARGSSSSNSASTNQRAPDGWDVKNVETFQFDDTTTIGHMILERQREKVGSLIRIEQDRALLKERAAAFPFQLPNPETHYLCITSSLSPSCPTPLSAKRSLRLPLSRLPLSPAALHRFKLLAGPRWIPPSGFRADGTITAEQKEKLDVDETEGYFEMSEEGWGEGRMNRKWLIDTVDKLVAEASNPSSPIPESTPLDSRPHLARLSKKKRTTQTNGTHVWARREEVERKGDGGGVRGFPKEWLS